MREQHCEGSRFYCTDCSLVSRGMLEPRVLLKEHRYRNIKDSLLIPLQYLVNHLVLLSDPSLAWGPCIRCPNEKKLKKTRVLYLYCPIGHSLPNGPMEFVSPTLTQSGACSYLLQLRYGAGNVWHVLCQYTSLCITYSPCLELGKLVKCLLLFQRIEWNEEKKMGQTPHLVGSVQGLCIQYRGT